LSQPSTAEGDVRIAGICGSLREGSYTRRAVEIALEGAAEVGVQVQLIDLDDYRLCFCDGKSDEDDYPDDVFRLREDVRRAQGLILGTPEYHGSFSGVLKNALDLMGFAELQGKMIGLVGVSGGSSGAVGALAALRSVGRAVHAWTVPEQASIANAGQAFDAAGKLKDAGLHDRVKLVGCQVARFAYLHSSEQARQFLQAWEGAQENPGAGPSDT